MLTEQELINHRNKRTRRVTFVSNTECFHEGLVFSFFPFSFPLLPCNTAARPNQFGMPGIVPPYVPSQMLNIPQTSLQAKPVVSTASALLLGRGLLCSANWNPGGKGAASFFSVGSHLLNFKSGTKVMLQTLVEQFLWMLKTAEFYCVHLEKASWLKNALSKSVVAFTQERSLCFRPSRCPVRVGPKARAHTHTGSLSQPSPWKQVGKVCLSRTTTVTFLTKENTHHCMNGLLQSIQPRVGAPIMWIQPIFLPLLHLHPLTMMKAMGVQ